MTPEEKPKRTENEEENPHLHQNWCQYHLQCSHHRLPFWSRLEPRCDCSTGCCLHLRNSFSIFQQCHLLLLFCELHAVIFFHASGYFIYVFVVIYMISQEKSRRNRYSSKFLKKTNKQKQITINQKIKFKKWGLFYFFFREIWSISESQSPLPEENIMSFWK